jgi:hypothetical protein
MEKKVTIGDVIAISYKRYRCAVVRTDFDNKFLSSLISNAGAYIRGKRLHGAADERWNWSRELHLSDKQLLIFNRIRINCENAWSDRCAYYKYSKEFEDWDIFLEKYDRETLESFKGIKEDENTKKWREEIMMYYKE